MSVLLSAVIKPNVAAWLAHMTVYPSMSRQCRADPNAALRVAQSGGVDAAVAVLNATGGAEALGLLWTLRYPLPHVSVSSVRR